MLAWGGELENMGFDRLVCLDGGLEQDGKCIIEKGLEYSAVVVLSRRDWGPGGKMNPWKDAC